MSASQATTLLGTLHDEYDKIVQTRATDEEKLARVNNFIDRVSGTRYFEYGTGYCTLTVPPSWIEYAKMLRSRISNSTNTATSLPSPSLKTTPNLSAAIVSLIST